MRLDCKKETYYGTKTNSPSCILKEASYTTLLESVLNHKQNISPRIIVGLGKF